MGESAILEKSIKIDTQKPELPLVEVKGENDKGWVKDNGAVRIYYPTKERDPKLTASYELWHGNSAGELVEGYTGTFIQGAEANLTLPWNSGVYTLKITSTSPAGTVHKTERVIKKDVEAPKLGEVRYNESIIGKAFHFLTFGVFGQTGKSISLDASDSYSGVEKKEYQVVEDGQPAPTSWQGYDAQNKPTVAKAFTGKVKARVWDKAGNISAEAGEDTKKLMTEDMAPTLELEPKQDTTAWQKEVTVDLSLKDAQSGVAKIEVQDSQDGKNFAITETYTLPYDSNQDPQNQSNLSWQGAAPAPGTSINCSTLPHGATVDGETTNLRDDQGLVRGEVKFSLTRNKTGLNPNTPSISVAADPSGGQYAPSYKRTLQNTNLAAEDRTTYKDGENLSGLTYSYSTDAGEPKNWIKVNSTPAYGDLSLIYNKDLQGSLYVKAESEAGITTNLAEVDIKIDQVAPNNGGVKIEADGQDMPNGLKGYYKTIPQVALTNPDGKDIDGKVRSAVTLWYRLDKGGNKGEDTPLGANIRDSRYQKTESQEAIGKNNNPKDTPKPLETNEAVTPINTQTAGATDPGAADQPEGTVAPPPVVWPAPLPAHQP